MQLEDDDDFQTRKVQYFFSRIVVFSVMQFAVFLCDIQEMDEVDVK